MFCCVIKHKVADNFNLFFFKDSDCLSSFQISLNLFFSQIHLSGKRNRGLSVIGSLRHLVSPDKLTEEDAKTAIILGWCVEWVSL